MKKNEDISVHDFASLRTAVIADYSTGTLTPAQTLAVESYLALNAQARQDVCFMDSIGGAILKTETCETESVSDSIFHKVCDRVDLPEETEDKLHICQILPEAITNYMQGDISDITWKRLAPGIEVCDIDVPLEKGEKAQLIKMQPGKSVFEHSHDGLELTVVLDGAFHDNTGAYHRGDLAIESGHDHAHAPIADEKQGCICLAVTSAPLHFTGLLGAVINPFVK